MKILYFTDGDITKVPPDSRIATKEAFVPYSFTHEQRKTAQEEITLFYRRTDDLWEKMLHTLEEKLQLDPETVATLVEEER